MTNDKLSILKNKYLSEGYTGYKVVNIRCPKDGTDCSDYITGIIENAGDHTIFSFDTGRYLIKSYALVKGKKDIIIEGNNSTFLQHYDSQNYGENASHIFHIEECENVVMRNIIVDSDSATQISGTVINVGEDYIDVKISNRIPFTGNEHGCIGYSHSQKAYCTHAIARSASKEQPRYAYVGGEIPTTNPVPAAIECQKIASDVLRLKNLYNQKNGNPYPEDNDFEIGTAFSLRYIYYGPGAFVLRNTSNVLIEDVRIFNFGGMGFVILPRCSDFTFNRLEIVPKEPDIHHYSTLADGIHTSGLGGKLVIKNSVFRNLGDDTLNCHSQIMKAKNVSSDKIEIYCDKKKPHISPYWCAKGDILRVYDCKTYKQKGNITVESFEDNIVTTTTAHEVNEEDFIINDSFRPEVLIENCVSYNMRGRAFIACGAKSMAIKNCEFYNTDGCALYITTAFNGWLEGAQVENVEFCNNYVVGCDMWYDENTSVISAKVRTQTIGFASGDSIPTLHSNLHIHDNVFENIDGQLVGIDYTDGVVVENNLFVNCNSKKEKISFSHCTNCTERNNTVI